MPKQHDMFQLPLPHLLTRAAAYRCSLPSSLRAVHLLALHTQRRTDQACCIAQLLALSNCLKDLRGDWT